MPRSRPPFPAVEGLYRRPTVINNVETLANVPSIIQRGAAWYSSVGVPPRNTGPKIFCLSGRVNRPGNYELPLGSVTIRELIDSDGQGVIGGKAIKVWQEVVAGPYFFSALIEARARSGAWRHGRRLPRAAAADLTDRNRYGPGGEPPLTPAGTSRSAHPSWS